MESIRKIYRIGKGPSSSHTMGPYKAAQEVLAKHPNAPFFKIRLYGSLALTGRGHQTDTALYEVFPDGTLTIEWRKNEQLQAHPNGMQFDVLNSQSEVTHTYTVFSIGGGAIRFDGDKRKDKKIYPHQSLAEIMSYINDHGLSFSDYVFLHEGNEIKNYIQEIWKAMKDSINRGLSVTGVINDEFNLHRKASTYYQNAEIDTTHQNPFASLSAYALAVSEENATGGIIVTAPTCGSCGCLPSVLRYMQEIYQSKDSQIIDALATAALIGNLVKNNASISGAEVGCQGEVGTACSMSAAAAAQLMGGNTEQIEYAAEMGMEHHLGLTCDPIKGLVQIPCIERNAHAASRAIQSAHYSVLSNGEHTISFDQVIQVMKETGKEIHSKYRETSQGGLATLYHN